MFKLIIAVSVVCAFVFGFVSLSLNVPKIKGAIVSVVSKGGEVSQEQIKKHSPAVKTEIKKATQKAKAKGIKELKKVVDSL